MRPPLFALIFLGSAAFLAAFPAQHPKQESQRGTSRVAQNTSALVVTGSACSAEGIQKAISSVSPSGGVVNVYCSGRYRIASNLWSGVVAPTKVIFGPGTFEIAAQQILPDNTEVAGSGFGTVFQIDANVSFDTPFDNGLFTNVLNKGGHDKAKNAGISLHDFKIDGKLNTHNTAGVSFYNVEHSSIHDLYIQSTWLSGVDLRNASDLDVHDNWCVDCALIGDPQHAIGGGVNGRDDVFLYNKFSRNHMSGGGGGPERGSDQFDIFGQGLGGNQRCGFNVITDNTLDQAPTVGIFLDNCNHNTVTGNVIRNAGTIAIACTSGKFNLDGGCAFNSFSNQIQTPGKQGYMFSFTSDNVISGGAIYGSGEEAILLNDSVRTKVEGVSVYAPSQSSAHKHCAVTINADGPHAYGDDNTIQNNTLNEESFEGAYQNKMKAGVCITTTGKATGNNVTNNIVEHNRINGGAPGSYNDGVYDVGLHNLAFCNAYGGDGATFQCTLEHQ